MKDIYAIEGLIRTTGDVAIPMGGVLLRFDLRHVHERRYVGRLLTDLRYPQMDLDEMLFRRFVQHGDGVLDAGANIGVTAAMALAAGASHVLAFEADSDLAARIPREPRITVHAWALGDRAGQGRLLLSDAHNQGNTLRADMKALFTQLYSDRTKSVQVEALDNVSDAARCQVWKLDVEGAEADVLRGATRLLAESPPRIILAEIYDQYFDEVMAAVPPSYGRRRAVIREENYTLELVEAKPGTQPALFSQLTSPTYVFERAW
ncbi:FkbM family methyltransferase [Reyranella sp. CPCC 100927]|uniref:FkbM family methyltransferase n=1 Tax=Reyranella sp. CPCC 100927 TaxID=2599616 RepID=UPI0011B853EF|nr:FkbM family methyltransferase [Reyranella sp. CPCC 100927]TWS97072.1 FkbM family methyltransferase [Reyranella sp. CPCC 100927]